MINKPDLVKGKSKRALTLFCIEVSLLLSQETQAGQRGHSAY